MRSSFEKQKLVRDVLHEGDYDDFREKVFRETRREFRRGHRRRLLPWIALAGCVLVSGFLVSTWFPRANRKAAGPKPSILPGDVNREVTHAAETFFTVVETVSLPDSAVVRSVAQQSLIVSTDGRGLPSRIVAVSSPAAAPATLNDQQMLALFANRPVGFMEDSSGQRFFILGQVADSR